jgi:hypothetical protein
MVCIYICGNTVSDVHVNVHHDKFLIINLDALISQIYFGRKLHLSDSSSVHHQEFFTVHTAMVYVIQVLWQHMGRIRLQLSSSLILPSCCLKTCRPYTIAVSTVKNSWWWTEELFETCRVSFQNKFEKSVHLVGLLQEKEHLLLNIASTTYQEAQCCTVHGIIVHTATVTVSHILKTPNTYIHQHTQDW